MPSKEEIPFGYCHCGCGRKTVLATKNATKKGWVKGEPLLYLHGHAGKKKAVEKTCRVCGNTFPNTLEFFHKKGKNSTSVLCKSCRNKKASEERKLQGILIKKDVFGELKCEICGREEDLCVRGQKRTICIDHNHKNGELRGLLCQHCNTAIGKFNDDVLLLQKAILYLEKYSTGNSFSKEQKEKLEAARVGRKVNY